MLERRIDPRFTLRVPGLVASMDGCFDCVVADLSLGGCMLEGSFPFKNETEVAIGFDTLMGLVGRVAYAGQGFVGVQFDEQARRRDDIRRWMVARLKAARASAQPR